MKNNYFTSKKFFNIKISNGFFSKKGGFSSGNFFSLNCSYNSGDNKNTVLKNIIQAQKKINLNKKKLKKINQVHSNKVIIINEKNFKRKFKADGLITTNHNISLAILTADCCPIFIFDKKATFICNLHAGWKGCYMNIIKNALDKIKKIQSDNKNIYAIIGPCLNKNNFEVNNILKEKFIKKNILYKKFFLKKSKDKSLFNMRELIKFQLLQNDVKKIENIDIDTYSNKELFFSHRRSTHENNIPTGRMINIIGFNN